MPYSGLADSHEALLYRSLVKQLSHYAIFRIGPEGRLESWNSGVEHLLGYSESEFLGQRFADLFTDGDRRRGSPEHELHLAASEGRSSDEKWHVRKDGTLFFADGLVTPIVDTNGEVVGFTKVLRDVTDRKIAEDDKNRLMAQLSELAHALDLTHTIIRGVDGTISVWTQGAEFMYGWSPSEARGRRTHELLHTEFPEPLETINQRLLEAGEWQGELTHAAKDGRTVTVASHWVLHAGGHGNALSVIEVNNDISHIKRIQAALEEANGKLERANEELASFAHEVAHDLKAPLRSVSTYVGLLSRNIESGSPQRQRELLDNIVQNSGKLRDLIDALLEYATVEGDADKVEPVALEETLKHVRANLSAAIGETAATLSWGPMPVMTCHAVRVLRLLQNLVGNAIKYARPGVPPDIRVSANPAGHEWRIDVADNGIGIEPEFCEKIFAPLKRLHGPEIPGAGLGLAISRRIVESEGGRIWAESTPGCGSVFRFTLPNRS